MIYTRPELEVPLYHWALRTHWLLRIGEDEARGLIQVVEGIELPAKQKGWTPRQQALLLAQELSSIHTDLEVLEDGPEGWITEALRSRDPVASLQLPLRLTLLRAKLEKMIHELVTVAGEKLPPSDSMDPFVGMLDAYFPAKVVQGLRTTGIQVTTFYEEQGGSDSPPVLADWDRAMELAVICDLGRCRRVAFTLEGPAEVQTVTGWVCAQLRMEVRDLKAALPVFPLQQREVA